ncbi:SapC family protein [Echinimonas agarilytica]|uniref:SapC family protein n=1 Tax=Echinimonas agarilytica TaxID=1215918 RepID=A0AA41W605_9GAMM|nr:SapC family protein [Echinimonas agarilytica]MCM2679370.1 SapC family protein [Echinimonas agarilytica]
MTKLVLVDDISHKNTKVQIENSAHLNPVIDMVPVVPSEIEKIASCLPVFLMKERENSNFIFVTIFGFEVGENLCIKDKNWRTPVQPLNILRQPFFLDSHGNDKLASLCIDMDNPRVQEATGEPLFIAGKRSDYLEYIVSLLAELKQGYEDTQLFVELLLANDLVEPVNLDISFDDGSRRQFEGLYSINIDELDQVPEQAKTEFEKAGYVPKMLAMMNSVSHVKQLIAAKNEQLAEQAL